MKKFIKKAIKENWHKHFGVAFFIQVGFNLFVKDLKDLRFLEQLALAMVAWYLVNMVFEWFQKYFTKHKGGLKAMHYDSLAAVAGGVFGVIVYSLF